MSRTRGPKAESTIVWLSSAEYFKGGIAALVQVSLTYPIHKITFRQQIHGTSLRSTVATLQSETMSHLFRGMTMPMAQRTVTTSIMFGVFHDYQKMLVPLETAFDAHRMVTNGVAGMMSGCTEAIMTPLERVQALMQSPQYHDSLGSSRAAFKECLRIGGVRELYVSYRILFFSFFFLFFVHFLMLTTTIGYLSCRLHDSSWT
eukprot:m.211850 g.211850  ORF g.211850 m.211850 type:complete len:203 (-) comp25506_c0_seq16:4431-5039(-)